LDIVETSSALCVVLGALVLLRFAVVRLGPGLAGFGWPGALGASKKRIRVLETQSLGMKQQIQLVEVDGCVLLLGVSESGVRRILRLPDAPEASQESGLPGPDETAKDSRGPRRPRLVRVLSGAVGVVPTLLGLFLAGWLLGAPEPAFAQDVSSLVSESIGSPSSGSASGPSLTISLDGVTAPDKLSETLQIVLLLTAISVAPSILLMATCFTRILIVLALLRQALGTATLPPSQVLVGLALMTTVYVMTPVGEAVYADSLEPYMAEKISGKEAMEKGLAPVRAYLLEHTRESDLLLFVEMKGDEIPEVIEEVSFPVLMPAFMISEIRAAFEIGFMIYLPFLVVDLVIASMLISLGMIMLPPVMIALPFKLMLFVLVDGWNLTLSALVSGLQ
jgi:flagellar biosynthetic protein FliP